MSNLVSVRLEIVLVSVQDRCTVCAKRTIGLDIIFNAPMVLLVDEAQLEARFSPCGDSFNLDARLVRGLRRMYNRLGDRFGRTRWNSLLDVGHVKSHFGLLGDSVGVGAI